MASIAAAEAPLLRDLATRVRRARARSSASARRRRRASRCSRKGLTEVRPGNYAYFDRTQVALGAATWDDCALTVLARVVSRPARDRIILDSGSKTLTNDGARGFTTTRGLRRGARGRLRQRTGSVAPHRAAVGGARDRAGRRRAKPRSRPATSSASSRTTPASCPTWSTRCGSWTATPVLEPLPVAARGGSRRMTAPWPRTFPAKRSGSWKHAGSSA